MNNTLTITYGPEDRPIKLSLSPVEDNAMSISIKRISTNSVWIDRETAKRIVEHLKNQFKL